MYMRTRVSIPYRYATNRSGRKIFPQKTLFQSLIGTLQTLSSLLKMPLGKWVSIPYRYATNGREWRTLVFRNYVSIPYRYATNSRISYQYKM